MKSVRPVRFLLEPPVDLHIACYALDLAGKALQTQVEKVVFVVFLAYGDAQFDDGAAAFQAGSVNAHSVGSPSCLAVEFVLIGQPGSYRGLFIDFAHQLHAELPAVGVDGVKVDRISRYGRAAGILMGPDAFDIGVQSAVLTDFFFFAERDVQSVVGRADVIGYILTEGRAQVAAMESG